MSAINVAVCSLNQLALDFAGNCDRIIESIRRCRQLGAHLRVGPELEICGYSCEDAFFELDTVEHSWQVLAKILESDFGDLIIDTGMPILKNSTLYNCRVIVLNKKILLIRPKTKLAGNGNYREERWFTAWSHDNLDSVWFELPDIIQSVTGQQRTPFGANIVVELPQLRNMRIGWEICEELWRADASNVRLFGVRGCHLICNSSASYWEIRKLDRALGLMKSATSKVGGCYAFSNLVGCDGQRICFYGRSLIALNGQLVTKTTNQNDELFDEVQIAIATVDTADIDAFRTQGNVKIDASADIGEQLEFDVKRGFVNCNDYKSYLKNLVITVRNISIDNFKRIMPNQSTQMVNVEPAEEIFKYASLWLWDYLRKTPMSGFIVPLSGGIDSSSVACIVYSLCTILFDCLTKDKSNLTERVKRLLQVESQEEFLLKYSGPKDICRKILRCAYLSTKFSGEDSRKRAMQLSELLGAEFVEYNFNHLFEEISTKAPNFEPKKKASETEVTLLEQNIQARMRMLLTYYFSGGDRLVLAAGNVDEALVGYLTKYDCSSADLNPIGSISKRDLRKFMAYFERTLFQKETIVSYIIEAIPSAELTGSEQSDELELGLTYDEQSVLGRLRRGYYGCFGPFKVFEKLWLERDRDEFKDRIRDINDPDKLAQKVKRFFQLYARNRHKQTVLTPALHAETYSPDDNRFDHRSFLINPSWTWQFKQIDDYLDKINQQ